MEIEEQVCSFKLAEKLKKSEIKQNSYFKWCFINNLISNNGIFLMTDCIIYAHQNLGTKNIKIIASAFTVAELGEILLKLNHDMPFLENEYWVYKWKDKIIKYKTEANARAELIIYLIENKLLGE